MLDGWKVGSMEGSKERRKEESRHWKGRRK